MRSSVRPDIKGLTRKPGDDPDTRSRRGATISVSGRNNPHVLDSPRFRRPEIRNILAGKLSRIQGEGFLSGRKEFQYDLRKREQL